MVKIISRYGKYIKFKWGKIMKKNILRLNRNQLKQLIKTNNKLERHLTEILQDYYMDVEIDRLLRNLHPYLKDYSIGFYNHNYIVVKDISDCNNWLTGINGILYPYLCDEDLSYIKKLEKAQRRFYNMDYSNKQYNNLQDYLYNQNEKINEILLRIFNDLTNDDLLNHDNLIDYMLEMELMSNLYVDTATNLIYEKQPIYALF